MKRKPIVCAFLLRVTSFSSHNKKCALYVSSFNPPPPDPFTHTGRLESKDTSRQGASCFLFHSSTSPQSFQLPKLPSLFFAHCRPFVVRIFDYSRCSRVDKNGSKCRVCCCSSAKEFSKSSISTSNRKGKNLI